MLRQLGSLYIPNSEIFDNKNQASCFIIRNNNISVKKHFGVIRLLILMMVNVLTKL